MIAEQKLSKYFFLQDGGEAGEIIQRLNWTKHPLGNPDHWPQALKTTLGIILHSRFPMFLFWGSEHFCFYNDAFRQSLGQDGKHPGSLGKPGKEVWPETWAVIGPMINGILSEKRSTWHEDQLIPINRNGRLEDVYWTFSYSPVLDEEGKVAGVFVTCVETTEKVLTRKKLGESKAQVEFALEAAELAMWDYNPATDTFTGNERYTEWFGVSASTNMDNNNAIELIAEEDRDRIIAAYTRALDYNTTDKYEIEFKIRPKDKPERILRAKGKAWFNEEKVAYRFTGTLQDVTEQVSIRKQIEESEKRFASLVKQAPVPIAVFRGKDLVTELANDAYLAVVDKTAEEFINLPLYESLPEVRPVVEPIINELFKTGKPFVTDEIGTWLTKNGEKRYAYFTLVYEPIRAADGSIDGFIVVANEITQQVIARKKAEDSEAKLQAIIQATPECIKIVDKDGTLQFMNSAGLGMIEGETSLVSKACVFDVVHPDYREAWIQNHLRVCSGESLSWQFEIIGLNGTRRYMETHAVPLKESNGMSHLAVTRDITERKKSEEVLKYRKALLEAQNEAIPDGILIVDTRGKILSYNQRFVEMWGIPATAMSAMDDRAALDFALSQVMNPEGFLERVNYCYSHPEQNAFDELRFKDGRFIERSGNPVIGEDGTSYGWAWCFRDVTQQKKAENDLRAVKNMLDLAFENTPTSIYLLDTKGKVVFANNNGARMVGFKDASELMSEENLPGLHSTIRMTFDLFSEDGITPYKMENSPTTQTLKTGEPSEDVILFVSKKDGKKMWALTETSCLHTDGGHLEMVLTTITDITQQKEAEYKIRVSEQHFRQLADSMPQIVWTARPDGYLDYYNKQWYEYTGFEENYGDNSWIPILHPDDVKSCYDTWYKCVEGGIPYQMEYRFRDRKNGGYRWFLGKGVPIKDDSGAVVKWFGTCTDIHHQKTFAEELEKLVAERTKALARSNDDLQQFAHVASHDLKEPLRKIRTFNNRIVADYNNGTYGNLLNYCNKIEHSAARMSSMIDGVLVYSSLEADQQIEDAVDLKDICHHILNDLELVINQKNAQIEIADLPTVRGSETLLRQLFYNLINNALKFTDPNRSPVISIYSEMASVTPSTLKQDVSYHTISVKDNGIGFEPEHAEKIFKTFARLHPKDRFEGTGLGLALCKKIVQRHAGDIVADAVPGNGATFKVYLPAASK